MKAIVIKKTQPFERQLCVIPGDEENPIVCDDDPNLKDLGSQIVDEIRKINGCAGD